jgi:aminomethyltransferase
MKLTKFNAIHKQLGAKLVDFAGYEMPVLYSSIISEHKAVRETVGVFDVSHMGEVFVRGENALDYVQFLTINDVSKLTDGKVQYSAMCYPDGGIIDDLLVYKISDTEFMLVVNASNLEKDFAWMQENNKFDVELDNRSDEYSLLAIQGPDSTKVLNKLTGQDVDLDYYTFMKTEILETEVLLSRTGYTGELGYELYFTASEEKAKQIWEKIFEAGEECNIQPVGLGARDSLRLEMGFCLYGNDIDKTTNPLEAGLGWITKLNIENDFIGKDTLKKIKENGIQRKLCALIAEEKAFPRHGYEIVSNNKIIGVITSGTISPMLDKPIALGYVDKNYAVVGETVHIRIRKKDVAVRIVKLPFVKN